MISKLKNPSNFTHGVYGYFEPASETFVYIGIDKDIHKDTRHKEHLKPSKRLIIEIDGKKYESADELIKLSKTTLFTKDNTVQAGQLINNVIQDHKLEYQVLALFVNDELMYDMETYYINKYKPEYNIKYAGWKEKAN